MFTSKAPASDNRNTEQETPPSTRILVIALGRHNAIGFNNYPDDKPIPPYFTGWLAYYIREAFVRYLAAAPRFERRFPGLFVWPGKRHYEIAQQHEPTATKTNSMQFHHV